MILFFVWCLDAFMVLLCLLAAVVDVLVALTVNVLHACPKSHPNSLHACFCLLCDLF